MTYTIKLTVRMRLAMLVARGLFGLRWLVGAERAQRWAWGAAYRLSRYRLERGPWRRLSERP